MKFFCRRKKKLLYFTLHVYNNLTNLIENKYTFSTQHSVLKVYCCWVKKVYFKYTLSIVIVYLKYIITSSQIILFCTKSIQKGA